MEGMEGKGPVPKLSIYSYFFFFPLGVFKNRLLASIPSIKALHGGYGGKGGCSQTFLYILFFCFHTRGFQK